MQQSPTPKSAELTDAASSVTPIKPAVAPDSAPVKMPAPPVEIGGREGPEPTRFGDWEKAGRCIDF